MQLTKLHEQCLCFQSHVKQKLNQISEMACLCSCGFRYAVNIKPNYSGARVMLWFIPIRAMESMNVISNGHQTNHFYYTFVVSTPSCITTNRNAREALHSNCEFVYHCHDNKRALTTEQYWDSAISIGSQELF